MRVLFTTREAGFTLLELMLVIVLISIFTGLMVAEMRGTYEDALLRSTARKIVSAVNLASSKAVTINRPVSLFVDRRLSRLRLQVLGDRSMSEEEVIDSRISLEIRSVVAAGEEDFSGPTFNSEQKDQNSDSIQFLPDGTADGREIRLRDRQGMELGLQINAVTGRVLIMESGTAQ